MSSSSTSLLTAVYLEKTGQRHPLLIAFDGDGNPFIFMLEVASALVGSDGWPYKQAFVRLREQGEGRWPVNLFASDSPAGIQAVASGEAQFAIINPATTAGPAPRGVAPLEEPIPLRAIATIPSFDQLGFAVAERAGCHVRRRHLQLD